MRTLPVLLLSLAACGGHAKSGGLGNIAGAGGPPGPAPTINWSGEAPTEGGTFETSGMPAVADDGSKVLIGWQMGDGGRGYANLRLLVVDRSDKTLETRVVLDADKVEETTAAIDVTADNKYLADSNAALRWRPLAAAPIEAGESKDDQEYPATYGGTLGDLAIQLDDQAHVVIKQGGKVVVDKVMSDWLVAAKPMYDGAGPDEVCSNPIFLETAYFDGARRLAVLGVEYHGNDSCWEPSGEYHVVTW